MRFLKFILIIIAAILLFMWIINAYIIVSARPFIFKDLDKVPKVQAIVVPGASVYRSGKLSPVLQSRVETAIRCMLSKDTLLMIFSGHKTNEGYNEPRAMADFARQRFVPGQHILEDPAGRSTYATIFNCRQAFNLKSILIVSQEYHLPRALYIAKSINLTAYGLVAPDNTSRSQKPFLLREFISRQKDFFLLKFLKFFR